MLSVHPMLDRFEGAKVREDRLQIIIRQVAVVPPRHDLVELPRLDVAGAYGLNKKSFIIVGRLGRTSPSDACDPAFFRLEATRASSH